MAVAQSVFNSTFPVGFPGMRANSEIENVISRTVESAAGIAMGQPAFRGSDDHGCIVGAAFAATSVGAAGVPAPAGATITAAPAVAAGAKPGVYTLICITAGVTGKWRIEDPDGLYVGVATTGTEFVGGGLTFTVTDSGTDPAVGEAFTIAVTFTANGKLLGLVVNDPGVPAVAIGGTPDLVPQYRIASIMNQGLLWVTAGASVNDGDQAYWNPATGRFTNTATHVKMTGVYFDTTSTDGNMARLAIRERIAA